MIVKSHSRKTLLAAQFIGAAVLWWLVLTPSKTSAADFPASGFCFNKSHIAKPEGDFEVLVVPLKRADNLLLIEATVDSVSGNFILDTGAPYLVLNKTYFRNGKLKDGYRGSGVTGGMNTIQQTVISRMQIRELYYRSLQADLISLGHIEDSKGVKILGLLGASLFKDLEMEIDVNKNVLYLYRLDKSGERSNKKPTGNPSTDLQIPIDLENNIIFVNASVGGSKLRYCLDTGAEINVLGNDAPNKVLQHFSLSSRNALTGTGNRRMEVFGGTLDEFTIGSHTFSNSQTILAGLSGLKAAYDTNIDGILGYNFLAEGRVIINFRKKQLTMYFYKAKQQ